MFRAHLTRTFWNILPPTFCSKNRVFQTTRVLGALAPEHGFQAQGWLSLGLSRQSLGEAQAAAGRTAPGPATSEQQPRTSLSRTAGGRATEVEEVTSEFLQTYKIHISVHVFRAVSSQAGGRQLAKGRAPTSMPASNLGEGWEIGPLGGPRDPPKLHMGEGPVPLPTQVAGHQTSGHVATLPHTPPGISPKSWQQQKGRKEGSRVHIASTASCTVQLGKTQQPTSPTDLGRATPTGHGHATAQEPHQPGALVTMSAGHWRPQGLRAPGTPHPRTPIPGSRGAKGTGLKEAGAIPKLSPDVMAPC